VVLLNTHMGMVLYVRTGCPYCAKVLAVSGGLGLELTVRNIADPEVEKELVVRGGKRQAPYLWNEATSSGMYESDAIVAHLKAVYG